MAKVHYLDDALEVLAPGEVSLDHGAPTGTDTLGDFRVSVSGQVHEAEGFVYQEKIDKLGPAGSAACANKLLALKEAVDQRRFPDIGAAGKRNFRQVAIRVLLGMYSRCDELGRSHYKGIRHPVFLPENGSAGTLLSC